jgi:hypothetical protein
MPKRGLHMQWNTWRKGVAGVVVAATATLVAAVVVPASGAVAAQAGSPAERWVTLVTGDRVLLDHQTAGDRFVRVASAKGREKVVFSVTRMAATWLWCRTTRRRC